MRIEMLHDHKRHPSARGQMAQQFHRRFESASRAANADDRAEPQFGFPPISQSDLGHANCGASALSLLRSRSRTSTLHSWGHVTNNDLQPVRIQAVIPRERELLGTRTVTDLLLPAVLQSNHVRLPSTSTTKAGAGQVLRPGPIHCYSSLSAAMVPEVYSMFPACVWISTFATFCASVVLFPLTLLPYEFLFYPVVRTTLWQWLWG